MEEKVLEELAKELTQFYEDFVHDKCDSPQESDVFLFLRDKSKVIYSLKNTTTVCKHEFIPCPGGICTSDLHTHHCMHCGIHTFIYVTR